MAGSIVISSIQLDSDNNFSILSNTGATLVSANGSGLNVSSSLAPDSITSDKIVSVANTKIVGNIVSSQITSVANTQLTGTVTSAQVGSSVYEGMGMRNRIINGDMRIDQRNAGSAVTLNSGGLFTVDRFRSGGGGAWTSAVFSAQQNRGSVTPPAGFTNYLGIATTTADASPGSNTTYTLIHPIEGFNIADLAWGTANAKTVTLSFIVYSNLTGTFGGSIQNNNQDRSYPFSFVISSANTWTTVVVTIPGETTGTWLTNNEVGMYVRFSLGAGSSFRGTANSWANATVEGVTGQQQVCSAINNTFYITGVQLEVGSVATPFERIDYGRQLIQCQRYYETLPDTSILATGIGGATVTANWIFKVEKRDIPTVTGSTGTSPVIGKHHCRTNNTGASAIWASGSTASSEL